MVSAANARIVSGTSGLFASFSLMAELFSAASCW